MCDISVLPNEHSKLVLYELLQDKNIKDIVCKSSSGSEKGDNYVGDIRKIKVISKKDGKSLLDLVLKFTPDKTKFPSINIDDVYDREAMLYKIILPTFKKLQDEYNVPKDEMFNYAKCYKADNSVLLLEDLSVQGFKMHNRFDSFDSNHLELVLRNLGRYHALSFVLKEYHPDVFMDFTKFLEVDIAEEAFINILNNMSSQVIDVVEESLKERLRVFCEDLYEKYKRLVGSDLAKPYNVLCHGDCWNNNMLFKYENGVPTDIRFLDWQISKHCSPITDIAYMLYGSTSSEIRNRYDKKIFDIYYEAFDKHLRHFKLNAEKCFPRRIFDEHVKMILPFGLLMGIVIVPIILTEKGKELDIDEMIGADKKKSLSFGKANTDRLNDLVKDFVEMNLI